MRDYVIAYRCGGAANRNSDDRPRQPRHPESPLQTRPVVRSGVSRDILQECPGFDTRSLGLSEVEAQQWQGHHALLKRLRQIAKDQGLTHAELARLGSSSRTRVTSILNGNLDNVSTDLLIRLLGGAGYRVGVSVSQVDSAA